MHKTFQAATETRPKPSLRDVAALETLAETYGNKKLSYCCDGRSYCMQYFNAIFIVLAISRPLNKKNPFAVSPRIQQLLRICVRKRTRPQSAHLCCI